MGPGATKWIWENSRASNGSLIVLLAIADEIGEGEFTEMPVAELARKCRLSDRAVRMAVKDLDGLGELSVTAAKGGVSRYALCPTPAKSAGPPRQILPDHPGKNYRGEKSAPRQNLPDPPEKPHVNGTPAKSADPRISDMYLTVTGSSLVTVKDVPAKPPRRRSDGREDVTRLCDHLASRIEANGCKRPNISEKWRDAARLMLDADQRTEQQVHAAIDWCQDSEFWRGNILSMPKLREKYDQLRMQAMRTTTSKQQNDSLGVVQRFMERAARMEGN